MDILRKIGAELDEEIVSKQNKANCENGNAILSSAAKLLGKGKYADMEKENTALKERPVSRALLSGWPASVSQVSWRRLKKGEGMDRKNL